MLKLSTSVSVQNLSKKWHKCHFFDQFLKRYMYALINNMEYKVTTFLRVFVFKNYYEHVVLGTRHR